MVRENPMSAFHSVTFQSVRSCLWCTALVLAFAVLSLTPARAATPADPNASPTTRAILNYLAGLSIKPDHRLISGQWGSWGRVNTTAIQKIHDMSGQWVGLVAADYYSFNATTQVLKVADVNPPMINYWKQGALIQIGLQLPNPETGGYATDTKIANYSAIYTPGTTSYNNYMRQLDLIAVGLQELQNNGVVVLFRPFAEMNGGWFWWTGNNSIDGSSYGFKELWIQTFNYLTHVKELHNLLWVYAAMPYSPSCSDYYPGSQYADIVGLSVFSYKGGKAGCYDELVGTGKPFAIDQFGVQAGDYTFDEPGYDLSKPIQDIKTYMPKAVYWISWDAKYNITRQLNVSQALNNPWVQHRPVPYGSVTTSHQSQNLLERLGRIIEMGQRVAKGTTH